MPDNTNQKNVVKQGGVAKDASETEDVTRDTYGFTQPDAPRKDRSQRLADANRAAASAGIPGVAFPERELEVSSRSDEQARDEEVRRAEISGDRVASRRDVEKLKSKGR
jgi:hypothetical protein